jgi:protoporphyrinogen/coproporphyrinogen III oxidase
MKENHSIIVLGAGISGLSCGYYLHQKGCDVLVLEKTSEAGGWLKTEIRSGFFFEKGPRTFRTTAAGPMEELIRDLHLEGKRIFSTPETKKRYLWMNQRLRSIPPSKWDLFSVLLKEWRVPPEQEKEETIWEFAARRFSPRIADTLFDPLTLGIFAGDCRKLSVDACFPKFKEWECEHGSWTKAFFARRKSRKKKGMSLFSFQEGIQTLPRALAEKLAGNLRTQTDVKALHFHDDRIEVVTHDTTYTCDYLVSALPSHSIAHLFLPHNQEIAALLGSIPCQTIDVVNLGYAQKLSIPRGFGYLVPSKEQEEIFGAIFDSMIFPTQNRQENETRLTVMVKEGGNSLQRAIDAMKRHLKILALPTFTDITSAKEAIPQYEVGHAKKIEQLIQKMSYVFPRCRLIGNYLSGVSVGDCIARAKEAADTLLQTLSVSVR